jgi:para-nitrobenzyl esterase
MRDFLVVFIVLATQSASAADSGPIVAITGGQIRGALLDKGGAVFKGIPFAQPPVGELRWREPMPVKPWARVRDATAFGPSCAQNGTRYEPRGSKEEDCLYLNVWMPQWPSKRRLPVMVWIHGGGNYAQSSSEDFYNGERLARRGIVLVSVDYRLGAFGFFAHPELTKKSPHHASGNQGILDQIAALKWVHDNIARFGGAPGNVTIFGESAGSVDVSVLMTSPLTKDFFQRVIAQSGAVVGLGGPETLSVAENRGKTVAAKLKLATGVSIEDLRAVPAAAILNVYPAQPDALRSLDVTVDGYVFPIAPARVFAIGQEHRADLIVGSNSREQIPGRSLSTKLENTIEETYGPLASRALTMYRTTDPVYGTPAEQWGTDTSFRCSAVAQLVWHASIVTSAYEYQFDRVAAGREAVGATHGSEVAYVFGTLDYPPPLQGPNEQFNAVDERVSNAMQEYWTNFAKTGNPNGGQLPPWPKFDVSSRAYIQFSEAGPVAKQGLRRPFCDLFIENVNRENVNREMVK